MGARELHGHLIGRQGSRAELNTPALVIDIDALEANIAAMAKTAGAAGVGLRPHAKTHKSVEIARRQIGAGALGACCAKLGEAEALSAGGIGDILITSPVVGAAAVERLAALGRRATGLMAVADHPDAVGAIARSSAALTLLVDIDPGLHRTGVAGPAEAIALARAIAAAPQLKFGGVQFYCGREQHIGPWAERRAAIEDRTAYLKEVIGALGEAGLPPAMVTGGGTGTHAIDLDLRAFTELQVGSYIFMDRQYAECEAAAGGGAWPFATALTIDTRVISANHERLSTVDAGFKAMATDGGPPSVIAGASRQSAYHFMGDEHGAIVPPKGEPAPALGQVVTLGAPHCDPTVNLYDAYHVVRDGTLIDIWPIEARGASA
ncbi:MAG TPA: DSD1 family PLP-dependent enzyme [Caulobacteraceae bacterium]|nr:DSD1 family PLP-dependent enzyme [Caulobacteraceae bacterium]